MIARAWVGHTRKSDVDSDLEVCTLCATDKGVVVALAEGGVRACRVCRMARDSVGIRAGCQEGESVKPEEEDRGEAERRHVGCPSVSVDITVAQHDR
jgi:hypothetical protein